MSNPDYMMCNDAQCHFIKEGIMHKTSDHDRLKREEVHGLTPEWVFRPTGMDRIHSGIKTGLSVVPMAGGLMSEIFSSTVESPASKRLQSYLTSIDYRIKDLEEKGKVNLDALLKNDEFIDIVIQASQIAVRNFSQPIKQIYAMIVSNKDGLKYIDVLADINKILRVEKILYDAAIMRLETDNLIDLIDKAPGPAKAGYYEKELNFMQLHDLVHRTKNIITPFGKMFVEFIT